MSNILNTRIKIRALYFLLLFLFMEVILTRELRAISVYSTYILEILYVFICLLYWKDLKINLLAFKPLIIGVNFGLGALFGVLSLQFFAPLPFQINSFFLSALFILLGPILEEFLFREALWSNFKRIMPKQSNLHWTNLITAIIFSLAHFQIYFTITEPFKGFILFQTFYTLIMGLLWGYYKIKKQNIFLSIKGHICFNLGFFLTLVFS